MAEWVHFIGEDGYYPAWAKGRWVLQRVFTTVRGMLEQIDELHRPWVSYESLIWAPSYGILGRVIPALRSLYEADKALEEAQRIIFICPRCNWTGSQPGIVTGKISGIRSGGPEHWLLRCRECGRLPEGRGAPDRHILQPDITNVDANLIVKRWEERRRPKLDAPEASRTTKSVGPIVDLHKWIERYEPSLYELAYVGQQMWPNFADFIWDMNIATLGNLGLDQ
jgi:hypothetical protein